VGKSLSPAPSSRPLDNLERRPKALLDPRAPVLLHDSTESIPCALMSVDVEWAKERVVEVTYDGEDGRLGLCCGLGPPPRCYLLDSGAEASVPLVLTLAAAAALYALFRSRS
jgi:hypothetical protein